MQTERSVSPSVVGGSAPLPLPRLAAVSILATIFCAAFAAVSAQDGSGCTVKGIMGTVKVFSARDRSKPDKNNVSTWPAARLNMVLRENDKIATLAESEVRIETPNGSEVRLKENTEAEVAALAGGAGTTKIKVSNGSVVANVKKMTGEKGAFELETPTSLAAIRGTTVELDSRKGAGTTVKTFDGTVRVTPAGSKNSTAVGNYEMTEVAPKQKSAKARGVPGFYNKKTTKLLSEEDAAALTGFRRVILTMSELEEVKSRLESDNIACGVGVGEASDEMTARKVSSDAARTELAKAMGTQVQRISESYAQNVGGEAKKIWEEGVRQITNVSVRGSSVHTTLTQFNADKKVFKVYSLMIMQPWRTKGLFANVVDKMGEEAELRVKKNDMMDKMDAAVQAYNTRYHDR
jgi:hypothetical protein